MRKIAVYPALLIALSSCGSSSSEKKLLHADSANNNQMTISSDSTTPGDGIINSNVISTDTAAINMQNSVNKANEARSNNKIQDKK